MRSFFLSDNTESYVGMRLAGISGIIVKNRQDALREYNKCLNDKDIGILILTENIFDLLQEEVMETKLRKKFPLIVEIPEMGGFKKSKNFLTNYISESIGINMD